MDLSKSGMCIRVDAVEPRDLAGYGQTPPRLDLGGRVQGVLGRASRLWLESGIAGSICTLSFPLLSLSSFSLVRVTLIELSVSAFKRSSG